jgi:hypothetical protein
MPEQAPTRQHYENLKLQAERRGMMEVPPSSDHYKKLKIEPIEYAEANDLTPHEFCVIKYISRWRFKDGILDLKKAKWYIERLIKLAESDNGENV